MMKKFIRIFIALSILSISYSQISKDEIKIDKVSVKGNQITSANTIIFTAGLREGQSITPSDFPRAIKRLWQLGLFQDIQIQFDKETKEGLSIIIIVEENYVLGDITFEGNKKLKDGKLKEKIDLSTGQRIKPNTINTTIELLKEFYAEKGYLNVDIGHELVLKKDSPNLQGGENNITRNLSFKIKENNKIKIGKIIIDGNKAFSDFRLRWEMKETKQQPWYFFWRSTFDKKKFEEDLNLISTFYRNKGYRDFHFTNDTIQHLDNGKKMDILLTLEEGPQYKYRNFSWEGMTLYDEQTLERALGLKKAEKYSDEDFNMAAFSRVQGLYLDRGYIYSRVEPKITPVAIDSLDIHFVITENHKVYINAIAIMGNTRTQENVIRRQLRVFPGDVYNQELIARSYREVMMLNFFANAAPNVVPVSEDKVNLEFVVEEKPAGQASANMGYSQYYGLTGGGGLSLPNFRGKGQSFSFSYNEGVNAGGQSTYMYQGYDVNRPKTRRASISFTDPMVNDTKNLLGASLGYDMLGGGSAMYYSPLETTSTYGSIVWGRIFKWPDDFFRGTWRFMVRRRLYEGTEEDLNQYAGGRTKTDAISFVQTIRRDSRDHPEFPTVGSHFSINSTLSGWVLGGQVNFHKHIINLEWYTPTFWKFVLMNSMKIGVVKELPSQDNSSSYIPYYDRFIMGGNGIPYGNPLRGYDDNRVGPLTYSGNPIGGNAMIKLATEFRVPFAENPVVYGIIFAEMGNVWSSEYLMETLSLPRNGPLDLKRSMGAGIRFFMPMIGMLGFDIGYGFDRVNQLGELEPAWKTTLTFGQQF
tara:strand:- start:2429 stop:4861 length:2433 start_codon:yes stop_codon:yes gene_type:complete